MIIMILIIMIVTITIKINIIIMIIIMIKGAVCRLFRDSLAARGSPRGTNGVVKYYYYTICI